MPKILLIIIFLSQCFHALTQETDYTIIWDQNQGHSILISKLHDQVKVRLKGRQTFIIGQIITEDSGTRFVPAIPFTNDLEYEVVVEDSLLFTFRPNPNTTAPSVLNIYPQSGTLPENFLKFYIEFDQPMGIGKFYDHVHLYKDKKEIKGAFLMLQPELWDDLNKVVTVWIDPGRIKTDLGPNLYQGPVLEKDKEYQLVLDSGIVSASGKHLHNLVVKNFEVIKRDNYRPDISLWTVDVPTTQTTNPLVIRMNEKMDYAIIDHTEIYHEKSHIKGKLTLQSDSILIFKPDSLWTRGKFQIQVESITEDLAGNNLDRLFEVDKKETPLEKPGAHQLNFSIR